MFDVYYTPRSLAENMVEAVPESISPNVIADFSVGEGSLLRAAASRWPGALLVGNDIDRSTAGRLKREFPEWRISSSDFLLDSSFSRTSARGLAGHYDLVLLNPPFSIRGNARLEVTFRGVAIKCGLAMAFLLRAAELLSDDGCIVAIIPAGSLSSRRDEHAWNVLRQIFEVDVVSHNGKYAFESVFPLTKTVRLARRMESRRLSGARESTLGDGGIHYADMVRGRIQMFRSDEYLDPAGAPLVHTCNIRSGLLLEGAKRVIVDGAVSGPLVLLPRVGNPAPSKVIAYPDERPIALSDCVIGLRCEDALTARSIVKRIHEEWATFKAAYDGTGAPYISLRKLADVLDALNIKRSYSI